MFTCPNINSESWKDLVKARGENIAYILWDKYAGAVPQSEYKTVGTASARALKTTPPTPIGIPENLQYQFKAVQNVYSNLDRVNKWYKQLGDTDQFWNKLQQDLQIPKDQIALFRNSEGKTIEEKLASFASNYSYTVEINTANTGYYSNLTVPGGTNYTENEIATPEVIPSIEGHAQFATDKGIGWFRSDEQRIGGMSFEEVDAVTSTVVKTTHTGEPTNTRRILEVQSDLFQKGRDRESLAAVDQTLKAKGISKEEATAKTIPQNKFLQLLNKDNNWVTFFVKSIIQDSSKKGYEKVLFPKGDTASKIEGHTTLEEFKKQKEDRIKFLDGEINDPENIERRVEEAKKEKEVLLKELERVEREGFGALKPIYNFYENTVANILKKQGYDPKVITDEYGNQWNEVTIKPSYKESILFQVDEGQKKVPAKTIGLIRNFLDQIGVSVQEISDNYKDINGNKIGINGFARPLEALIGITKGKMNIALPEEAMHMAIAIVKATNPTLYQSMVNKIKNLPIYKDVYFKYSNIYTKADGSIDEEAILEEAIGKLLADTVVNKINKKDSNTILSVWDRILNWIKDLFSKSSIDPFETIAKEIAEGTFKGNISQVTTSRPELFQLDEGKRKQQEIIAKYDKTNQEIEQREATPIDEINLGEDENKGSTYWIKSENREVANRVTDVVKRTIRWLNTYVVTPFQQYINNQYAKFGITGHNIMESLTKSYLNPDGTIKTKIDAEGNKIAYRDENDDDVIEAIANNFTISEKYNNTAIVERLDRFVKRFLGYFPEGTVIRTEQILYDPTGKEKNKDVAGKSDLIAILPNGKQEIFDWKFISLNVNDPLTTDIKRFHKEYWPKQISKYKQIAENYYKSETQAKAEFGRVMVIPIVMDITQIEEHANGYRDYDVRDVYLTSIDTKTGEFILDDEDAFKMNKEEIPNYLLPLTPITQATENEEINDIIASLTNLIEEVEKGKNSTEKFLQIENIRTAIRYLQVNKNFNGLLTAMDSSVFFTNKWLENTELGNFDFRNFSQISDLFAQIKTKLNVLATYKKNIEQAIDYYKQNKDDESLKKCKEIKEKIEDESKELTKFSKQAIQNFGNANNVANILSPEKNISWLDKTFSQRSQLPTAGLQLFSNIVSWIRNRTDYRRQQILDRLSAIEKELGNNKFEIYKLIKQKSKNKLVPKYKVEFYETYDKLKRSINTVRTQEGRMELMAWVDENMDLKSTIEQIKKWKEAQIEDARLTYYRKEDADKLRDRLDYIDTLTDLDNPLAYFKVPLRKDYIVPRGEKWLTDEYKSISANKTAKKLYDTIFDFNQYAREIGYLKNDGKMFLPNVYKDLTEKLLIGGELSVIDSIMSNVTVDENVSGYGKINELGIAEDDIPTYFTKDLEDPEKLSEDILKNFALYATEVIKFEERVNAEPVANMILYFEQNKDRLKSTIFGKVVNKVDLNGNPREDEYETEKGNEKNAEVLAAGVRNVIYGQRYAADNSDLTFGNPYKLYNRFANKINKTLNNELLPVIKNEDKLKRKMSLVRTLEYSAKYFTLSKLGLNISTSASVWFGGQAQSFIRNGWYYDEKDFYNSEMKFAFGTSLFGDALTEDNVKSSFGLLKLFLPVSEIQELQIKELSLKGKVDPSKWSDYLMVLMRTADHLVQYQNFGAFMKNTIVIDGKIWNVREYLRAQPKWQNRYDNPATLKDAEKEFLADMKDLLDKYSIKNQIKVDKEGTPYIEGLKDIRNLYEYRDKIKKNAADAIGTILPEDDSMIRMHSLARFTMVFKNWIPPLITERYGGHKYDTLKQRWEMGRYRQLATFLTQENVKVLTNLGHLIKMDEKGVEIMKNYTTKMKAAYKARTGKELDITDADYIDMTRRNITAAIKEAIVLSVLISLMLMWGWFKPDDDDDYYVKAYWRSMYRSYDKIQQELTFYVNPFELMNIINGNVFPLMGIISDAYRFTTQLINEITGVEFTHLSKNPTEVREDAHPTKYLMKMIPVTSQVVDWISIFSKEWADSMDNAPKANYHRSN